MKLYDLWMEQPLSETFDLRLGQEGANDELMTSLYGALFLNSSFGFPGLPAADLVLDDAVLAEIDRTLAFDPVSLARFRLPASEGASLHLLHEHARVLSSSYEGEECLVEAEVPESVKRRLAKYAVE